MISSAEVAHSPERSRIEIDDPDEVEPYLEAAYGAPLRLSQTLAAPSDGAALLSHTRTDAGPFLIDELQIRGELKVSPDPLDKVLTFWAARGSVTSHCAGISGRAGPGEITMAAQHDLPSEAHTLDLSVTMVLLNPALVAAVATGVPSEQAPLPIRFIGFGPVDPAAGRLWKGTVSFIKHTVLSDDSVATPLVLGHAARLLAAATLAAFPNSIGRTDDDARERIDNQPALLRKALDFIDANAATDIALSDIARAVHVSPRAVQYMFRRHLETTPLQYLRRLRLHHAHQELLAGDHAHDTVTNIAARWGFAHTGRFAVLYRETYGQSPHTTLRS